MKRVYKQKKVSPIEGYRFVDMELLQALVTSLACPECYENKLVLEEDNSKKKRLASYIIVSCTECCYEFKSYTSKTVQPEEKGVEKGTKGMKPYEVNISVVYSLHSCGLGHTGLEKLCCMLMPAPMIVTNYNKISNTLRDAAKTVAVKSMKDAVVDAKKYKEGIADIGVSVDGTWQERGTLIAITIDTGKIALYVE